jgi:outer membrane lipopolysaccharide assembly protein LptE/RlpB|tara:strand:- start:12 stop:476 length:465 start_codon:yes stop_codon:yes gene_type:complete
MMKKTILIFAFLLMASCGYETIHSKKNSSSYNFSINSIDLTGDRDVNLKIKQKLNSYVLNKKEKEFNLIIKTEVKKEILAKDITGDPISFRNTALVNVEVFINNTLKNKLQIQKNIKYNNKFNKLELKTYEKELKSNLAQSITEELIYKLSNIQ